MTFTREQVLATWEKFGTGESMPEAKIEHMLKVLNQPVGIPDAKPFAFIGRDFVMCRQVQCGSVRYTDVIASVATV